MEYKASQVLASIILEKGWKEFNASPNKIHSIFYELYKMNQDTMKNFKFVKRINPFSTTLDQLLVWFQLVGALSLGNPDYAVYQVNKERLEKIKPSTKIKLKGDEVLDPLSCS